MSQFSSALDVLTLQCLLNCGRRIDWVRNKYDFSFSFSFFIGLHLLDISVVGINSSWWLYTRINGQCMDSFCNTIHVVVICVILSILSSVQFLQATAFKNSCSVHHARIWREIVLNDSSGKTQCLLFMFLA